MAAFDRVVRSAVGLKRRTIPALKIALDQPDIVICCKVSLPGITAQRSVSRPRFLESTIALPVAIALQIFHAGALPVNLATDPSTGSGPPTLPRSATLPCPARATLAPHCGRTATAALVSARQGIFGRAHAEGRHRGSKSWHDDGIGTPYISPEPAAVNRPLGARRLSAVRSTRCSLRPMKSVRCAPGPPPLQAEYGDRAHRPMHLVRSRPTDGRGTTHR